MEFLTSDEILPKIKEITSQATSSIKIASAWIKGRSFEEILDAVKGRGLSLEVVLRASELQDLLITDDRVFKKIKEVGGKVYLCSRLHAKFIIVDENKAVVGSANFTDAGLSDISTGNIEAGVFYELSDGDGEVRKLVDYFERLKREHSGEFGKDLLGFALNPVKPQSFEFILVDEDVGLQSYVEVRLPEGKVLGRVTSIYAYDMGFFANPFTSQESVVFAPLEDFKKIFSDDKDGEWKKAAVYAYTNSNGNRMKIATADIVGIVRDGKLDVMKKPFNVGETVYKVSRDTLAEVLKKNFSGADMKAPVRAGVLEDSDIDVFIDAREIINRHMLVIGTTGSGKSYFVKCFLCELLKSTEDVQVFVFDPHGEYAEVLRECVNDDQLEYILFNETLFPIYLEEVKSLIEETGYGTVVGGNSNEGKDVQSYISKVVKPSIRLSLFSKKNLEDLINELPIKDKKKKEDILNYLREIYGSGSLKNQKETVNKIESGINSKKRVVIFDLKEITNPQTRVNIAGLIMQELFNRNKREPKDRLIVLEEAHNFAPERGFGDVSAGRNNLSLTAARRIASEGRKFNLGLITITQRPAQVSKYVLAQMNTQAMFRTINASDIDSIATLIEYAGGDIISTLPSLPTGTGILSGMGVPFPIVVEVKTICSEVRDTILKILREKSPGILNKSGGILYSSFRTVREGDFFIMGLNPGGDPNKLSKHTIEYDVEYTYKRCIEEDEDKWWNAYLDEDWNNKGPGTDGLQMHLRFFVKKLLGSDECLRKICASNLCFIRTQNEKDLKNLDECFDLWWPVNEWLLKQVKPKILIVFSEPAYNYLKRKFKVQDSEKTFEAGWGNWGICLVKAPPFNEITGKETVLLYIPHLSRYSFEGEGREVLIEKIKDELSQYYPYLSKSASPYFCGKKHLP